MTNPLSKFKNENQHFLGLYRTSSALHIQFILPNDVAKN